MSSHRLQRGQPRPSALAGRWYPGDADTLAATVRAHLAAAAERPTGALPEGPVVAVISPHAGHIYSGPMAGRAFAAVRGPYRRVVLIGPAHRVAFHGVSAGDFASYAIPTATFPVDRAAIADLEGQRLVTCVPEAHADEHCLEIILPFVAEALGEVPILPLLASHVRSDEVERVLEAALRPDDLLVVSSDLSHYHPYDEARQRDRRTLEAIVSGHGETLRGDDACGYLGIRAALDVGARRGWRRTLLGYQSSGDTAGDKDAVVGYGAVAFTG
ncbi:MAG: AmmeMemoRadiSam system protein B [Deltaproteobacteria bacterium]|nr:MAG: AmmeMemoRadiSam system protein B [Deltaproteobacteria bacterium]